MDGHQPFHRCAVPRDVPLDARLCRQSAAQRPLDPRAVSKTKPAGPALALVIHHGVNHCLGPVPAESGMGACVPRGAAMGGLALIGLYSYGLCSYGLCPSWGCHGWTGFDRLGSVRRSQPGGVLVITY